MQASLDTGHINFFSPEYFFVLLQTTGMDILEFELFDHSKEIHYFGTAKFNGFLRGAIRKALLQVNPLLASRIFCYHCGALIGIDCMDEKKD